MYVNIQVSSHDESDLATFIQFCKTIQNCCAHGASRTLSLIVDGDGSASLKFDFGATDVTGVEPINPSGMPNQEFKFYIGE